MTQEAPGTGESQVRLRLRLLRSRIVEIAATEMDPVSELILDFFDDIFPELTE